MNVRYRAVIIPLLMSLIFLGMRVPDIRKLHRPKPRPRAVIKQVVKVSHEIGQRLSLDADLVTPSQLLFVEREFVRRPDKAFFPTSLTAALPASRGPPSV